MLVAFAPAQSEALVSTSAAGAGVVVDAPIRVKIRSIIRGFNITTKSGLWRGREKFEF